MWIRSVGNVVRMVDRLSLFDYNKKEIRNILDKRSQEDMMNEMPIL